MKAGYDTGQAPNNILHRRVNGALEGKRLECLLEQSIIALKKILLILNRRV